MDGPGRTYTVTKKINIRDVWTHTNTFRKIVCEWVDWWVCINYIYSSKSKVSWYERMGGSCRFSGNACACDYSILCDKMGRSNRMIVGEGGKWV